MKIIKKHHVSDEDGLKAHLKFYYDYDVKFTKDGYENREVIMVNDLGGNSEVVACRNESGDGYNVFTVKGTAKGKYCLMIYRKLLFFYDEKSLESKIAKLCGKSSRSVFKFSKHVLDSYEVNRLIKVAERKGRVTDSIEKKKIIMDDYRERRWKEDGVNIRRLDNYNHHRSFEHVERLKAIYETDNYMISIRLPRKAKNCTYGYYYSSRIHLDRSQVLHAIKDYGMPIMYSIYDKTTKEVKTTFLDVVCKGGKYIVNDQVTTNLINIVADLISCFGSGTEFSLKVSAPRTVNRKDSSLFNINIGDTMIIFKFYKKSESSRWIISVSGYEFETGYKECVSFKKFIKGNKYHSNEEEFVVEVIKNLSEVTGMGIDEIAEKFRGIMVAAKI